ncbi:hypothetical protein MTO96_038984 [Rhipicephalus appendiculatus]
MRGLITAALLPSVGPFMRSQKSPRGNQGVIGTTFPSLPAVAGVGVGSYVLCRTRNQMRSTINGTEALWGLRTGPIRSHLL